MTKPLDDIYLNPGDELSIDLSTVFEDPEGETLSYTATSDNNQVATATVSDTTLSITTSASDPGTATVTATATEPDGLSASDDFLLTVDFLPEITITAQHAERNEGEDIRFTLSADPAPVSATEVKVCISQGESDYLDTAMPSSQCDPSGALDVTTNRFLAVIGFGALNTGEELILQLDDDFTSEEDGRITAMIIDKTTYPYTAGSPNAATAEVRDNDTVTVGVDPRPLRHARVHWQPLPQADGYEMQVQQAGGTWTTPPTIQYGAGDTERNVNLDHIIDESPSNPLGMVDNDFDFRVRAHRTVAGAKQYTPYSQTVRVTENPLLQPGGSAYSPKRAGVAELSWSYIANVKDDKLTVRYRPLGGNHSAEDWPNSTTSDQWPFYGPYEELTNVLQTASGSTTEATSLSTDTIYAFQVTYETNTPENARIFSAREAYVWPEAISPADQPLVSTTFPERIATFPIFGHHPSKEFQYIICDNASGFGMDTDQADWEALINAALNLWQNATDSIVTVGQDARTPCSASRLTALFDTDDNRNEVRVFDLAADTDIFTFHEFSSDPFKACLLHAHACVTSFTGYAGTYLTDSERADIATLVAKADSQNGLSSSERIKILELIIRAERSHQVGPATPLRGVDINFKKAAIAELITGTKALNSAATGLEIPSSTFGQCRTTGPGTPGTDEADREFGVFTLALHETGHALGISGFNYEELTDVTTKPGDPLQSRKSAHPTVPDSVMNYDEDVHTYFKEAGDNTFREHDCAPHPLDILAINALYQNIR